MNELKKINVNIIVVVIIAALFVLAGGITGFIIGGKNTVNSSGAESNLFRERELLTRIREYEQREQDRAVAERGRIAAENYRIARERARVERTAEQLAAIRLLDRRSGDLLQELVEEVNILESYFRDSYHIISDNFNNLWSD